MNSEDIIIQTVCADVPVGSFKMYPQEGIKIYHKKLDATITVTHHTSAHKNRAEAITILEDLLTPIAFGSRGFLIVEGEVYPRTLSRWEFFEEGHIPRLGRKSVNIANTLVCAKYLARLQIQDQITKLEEGIINLYGNMEY